MEDGELKWLEPVNLDFASALENEESFLKTLRKQVRDAVREQEPADESLKRSVYIIRMTGQFLVAYGKLNSPVLYIGRGTTSSRVASHLRNWLYQAHTFGNDIGVEIRIVIPRRKKRPDFYKNVEADLLYEFKKKHNALPFFNGRSEHKYAQKIRAYSKTNTTLLSRAIGVGAGKRPQWAIRPTKANANFATYLRGFDEG